jgi:GH15 family glucan-1,4-alpha-glucosidase
MRACWTGVLCPSWAGRVLACPGELEGERAAAGAAAREQGQADGRTADPGWPALRDTIAADVLEHGWNEEAQAFTAAYDGTDLDAASLHVGLSGLLDPASERFQATVTAVEAELRAGSAVYRYRRDDGLPGQEGGFHLCTAWPPPQN